MDALEQKKLKVSILRAEANIGEFELKIQEKLDDIENIKKHIEQQKKIIEDSRTKLGE